MARVLLATDGSDLAVAAAGRAVGLLGPAHAYTLLTVVPPPVAPPLPAGGPDMAVIGGVGAGGLGVTPAFDPEAMAEREEVWAEEAAALLERTAAALPPEVSAGAERRVEQGDPASSICQVATDEGFDVVVVGSHGTGFVRRLLLGSVSHHVLHHAHCPVLVVRDPEAAHDGGDADSRSSE